MSITRDRAIFIFFSEEYPSKNIDQLKQRFESIVGLEMCYAGDLLMPMTQTKTKIAGLSTYYHKYRVIEVFYAASQ